MTLAEANKQGSKSINHHQREGEENLVKEETRTQKAGHGGNNQKLHTHTRKSTTPSDCVLWVGNGTMKESRLGIVLDGLGKDLFARMGGPLFLGQLDTTTDTANSFSS